jgi:hypothetical protein
MFFFNFVITLYTKHPSMTQSSNQESQSLINKAKDAIHQKGLSRKKNGVKIEDQNAEIISMKEIVKHEKFFFVVDAINNKIENANGIERWLGYNDEEFSLELYFSIIHPSYMEFLIHLAKISYQIANSTNFEVAFRQHQYVIDVALKHKNGHYVLCKRSLTAWQWEFNSAKRVISHYFNEFTVTNTHIEDINPNLLPRLMDVKGNKLFDLETLFKKNSIDVIENIKIFSPQELRIIRKVAYQPTITSAEIAISFKNKVNTIRVLNTRIIEKGKRYFNDDSISNVKELALRMKKNFMV